jgi:hypothetical protein
MNIKEYYTINYPYDELGLEIKDKANFYGLLNHLILGYDIYKYIGVHDSVIRERLFNKLADDMNVSYDYVYSLWLNPLKA